MIGLGDIHGHTDRIVWLAKTLDKTQKNIFQVGDFGLGFHGPQDVLNMAYLSNKLEQYDKYLYVIRGNHDDPKYWKEPYITKWKRIMLIPDYSVVEIEERNVLCIGGATSIDRVTRIAGRDYWKDEAVIEDWERLDKCLELKIDIVASHNAPNFANPLGHNATVQHFCSLDENLLKEINAERALLTKIWDKVKEKNNPTHYIYGHHHLDNNTIIDGTEFICLGIGSIRNI